MVEGLAEVNMHVRHACAAFEMCPFARCNNPYGCPYSDDSQVIEINSTIPPDLSTLDSHTSQKSWQSCTPASTPAAPDDPFVPPLSKSSPAALPPGLRSSMVQITSPVVLDSGAWPRLQAPTTRQTPSGLFPHRTCTQPGYECSPREEGTEFSTGIV